jgi:hypothetical protein
MINLSKHDAIFRHLRCNVQSFLYHHHHHLCSVALMLRYIHITFIFVDRSSQHSFHFHDVSGAVWGNCKLFPLLVMSGVYVNYLAFWLSVLSLFNYTTTLLTVAVRESERVEKVDKSAHC